MGIFSRFENKMEDAFDNIGDKMFDSPISPVQIAKKCEKEMRRGKMVGAGKQYAPTLYTILVNRQDDRRLIGYYPTLAGETETYLEAKANEQGLVLDGHPLVRFISDESLKSGKFDVVAEAVAGVIVEQLRQEEFARYGANTPQPDPQQQNQAESPVVNKQPEPAPQQQVPSAFAPYDVEAANAAANQLKNNANINNNNNINDGFGEAAPQNVNPTPSVNPPEPQPQMPSPALDTPPYKENNANYQPNAAPSPVVERENTPNPVPDFGGQMPPQQPITAAPTQIFQPAMLNSNAGQPPAHFRDMAAGRIYAITQENTLIGRDTTCNLCLTDVNASRQHAQLEFAGNAWVVTDLNSTNGTYVNDQRITSSQIVPGDVVTIGLTNLEFNVG